jgi:hypothetical protein
MRDENDDAMDGADERTEIGTAEVVVRPLPPGPAPWRGRALALRAALPQLARHPVVVGASAAAATVAVRIAVDVARRAVTGSAPARPMTLDVTGSILHEVRVERHVHVVHDVVHHHVVHYVPSGVLWRPLPPPH